jgi:hypothetical protein
MSHPVVLAQGPDIEQLAAVGLQRGADIAEGGAVGEDDLPVGAGPGEQLATDSRASEGAGGQGHDAPVALGRVAELLRLAKGGLQPVDLGEARIGKLIPPGRPGRVVGVGLERGDGEVHPCMERQNAEQTIELGLAVGAVQANDRGVAGPGGLVPDPDKMPLVGQLGCGGGLGALAVLDLSGWGPVGNVDLELDQDSMGFSSCPRLRLGDDVATVMTLPRVSQASS